MATVDKKEKFVPKMQLVINAFIEIKERVEGEELYRQLKEILKNYTTNLKMHGQIMEILEPCCGEKTPDGLSKNAGNSGTIHNTGDMQRETHV